MNDSLRIDARRVLLALLAATTLPTGCASVSVRKVPASSQYLAWSDQRQEQADALEGVRFYMPRPYVRVKEPFLIGADVYLAQAVVSADGQTAMVTSLAPMSERRADGPLLPPPPEVALRIPLRRIVWRDTNTPSWPAEIAGAPAADISSGEPLPAALALAAARGAHAAASPATTLATPAPAPAPDAHAAGITARSVNVDNAAWARTPIDGPFDVVFLPDFEEQYVVTGAGNLGDARVHLSLGQGWSLQSLDATADNRLLNKRIFDLIDSAAQMALAAARAALAAAVPATTFTPESAPAGHVPDARDQPSPAPGTPVVLKVTVLRRAAVGLYPLLKPGERRSATAAAPDQGTRLDLPPSGALPTFRHIVIDSVPELIVEAISPR